MASLSVLGLVGAGGLLAVIIGGDAAGFIPVITGILAAYIAYLVSGPFLQAATANLMWNQTEFDGVQFESHMEGWPFVKLQAKNVLLTLLTLGLYRPFAAVATYRYRLSRTVVVSALPPAMLLAGEHTGSTAAGDGAADLLDFDISW
jgi:uncharacterized membrane protein YjgN (DUF898 family)